MRLCILMIFALLGGCGRPHKLQHDFGRASAVFEQQASADNLARATMPMLSGDEGVAIRADALGVEPPPDENVPSGEK